MYLCMLAGMGAEYLSNYFDASGSKADTSGIGAFLQPFLKSPLVFMPLAVSLQSANLDLSRFDAPRLMLFLVAFENGFLWRGYSRGRMNRSQRSGSRAKRSSK
jgi:hypothetical protein